MLALVVAVVGVILLPCVAWWIWRLQLRVVRSLVPGAEFDEVAQLADLPVSRTLGATPTAVAGPLVRLLGVTREAATVFLAYRQVGSGGEGPAGEGRVRTLLVRLDHAGTWEMAVLERWRSAGTALVVAVHAGEVAIQQAATRLTVTLPLVA